jgi:hypothetical protein
MTLKFGWFEFGNNEPFDTYDGDRMMLDKEFVRIWEGPPNSDAMDSNGNLVAAIRLEKGQCVRKITDRKENS